MKLDCISEKDFHYISAEPWLLHCTKNAKFYGECFIDVDGAKELEWDNVMYISRNAAFSVVLFVNKLNTV